MIRMTRYGDNYNFLGWVPKKNNTLLRKQILEQMEKQKIKPFGPFRTLSEPWVFISRHDLQESGTSGLWITTTRPNRWSTCRTLSRCRKVWALGPKSLSERPNLRILRLGDRLEFYISLKAPWDTQKLGVVIWMDLRLSKVLGFVFSLQKLQEQNFRLCGPSSLGTDL